jgi:hypothetical protein
MTMTIQYEIRPPVDQGPFMVGYRDKNGEWWDADREGFDTLAQAEEFRKVIQDIEDSH